MPNMMLVMQNEEEYDISGFYVETKKVLARRYSALFAEKLFKVQKNKLKQA